MFEQNYGALAAALAGCYTSISNSADAVLWNAAGLSKIERQELSFMYGKPYVAFSDVDLSYQYLSYARYIAKFRSGMGIAWAKFNNSDVYKQEIIAVGISYLISPLKYFAVGVAIKYMGHKFNFSYLPTDDSTGGYKDNKYGISIDVGILYNLRPNIRLGVTIRNVNSPDIGISSRDVIPMEIRIGMNVVLYSKSRFTELTPIVEFVVENNRVTFSIGMEASLLKKSLFLRAGFNDYEIALGFGWNKNIKNFILKIDYAYSIPTQLEFSGGSHRISIGIKT